MTAKANAAFERAYLAAVEEQIKAQDAWIEATGDVSGDPAELGALVTALHALSTGDDPEFVAAMLLQVAVGLREMEEVEARENQTV